ncbi:hypothetical protein ACPCAA_17710 [Streptomyces griseoincarnatus]
MDVTITVRRCDNCKSPDKEATRYTLTVDEGEPVTRDLCDEDAAPLLEAFGGAVAPASAPVKRTPAPRKAPAEKAPAKKAASRRRGRTPVKTLEEIEAEKAAKAAQS